MAQTEEFMFQIVAYRTTVYRAGVKTTCFTQYFRYLNPKGEDSSCKNDGFIAIYTSKLKWAWQA